MKVGEGDTLDRYYTPFPFARAHVRHLVVLGLLRPGMTVVDAGCGDASYLRAVLAECPRVTLIGVEIDPDASLGLRRFESENPGVRILGADFLKLAPKNAAGGANVVVLGNPPFTLAEAFIAHARTFAGITSFLLQSQFVSGGKRNASGIFDSLQRCDPFTTRPKFYGPAIDAINERRKAEGKGPAGGNSVDYSAFSFSNGLRVTPDYLGRHIAPIKEAA